MSFNLYNDVVKLALILKLLYIHMIQVESCFISAV